MCDTIFIDFTDFFKDETNARVVADGDEVFREGEPGDNMYVILAGQVEIKVGGKYVDAVGEGSIIGEMALLGDSPRSATAVAMGECRLVVINQERFLGLIKETPEFAINVMRMMADRLRGMNMLL